MTRGYHPAALNADEVRVKLAVDWTKLFRGVQKGYGPPPPYESVYLGGGILHGPITDRVAREYESHGVKILEPKNELPDFIAVELAFMSALANKEAKAWEGGDGDCVEVCRCTEAIPNGASAEMGVKVLLRRREEC